MTQQTTRRGFRLFAAPLLVLLVAGLAWGDGGANHQVQQNPLGLFGVSGINANMCCSAGTLGSLVQNSSGQYILSNNHVLARTNKAALGEAIVHVGYLDNSCAAAGTLTVGNLSKFVTIKFGSGANKVDAAIALINGNASYTGIMDIGAVSSTTQAPALGLAVKKSGRTTGLTTGSIASVNVSVKVLYSGGCNSGSGLAKFVNQFLVTPGNFSAGGDSGSLIVTNEALNPKPVGLLFAGSSSYTIANPINEVLSALGVSFGAGSGSPSSPSSADSGPGRGQGRPSFVDQLVGAVSQVMERHSEALLAVPGAVGHGVGLSRSGSNELVIQLFVREANEEVHRAAPQSLEGVRVEVVETGEFIALPAIAGNNCR